MINTERPTRYPEELPDRKHRRKNGVIVDIPESECDRVEPDEAFTPQADDLDLIQL